MLLTIVRNPRGRYHMSVRHDRADDRTRYVVDVRKFLPEGFTFHTRVVPHICSRNPVEVGLSGCTFGCKVYRCDACGTRSTLHSLTYGCRHPQAQ